MKRIAAVLLWIAAIVGLFALGTWQVERLAWKRALIAQVDARLAAAPVAAPRQAAAGDAYRRIRVTGTFLPDRDSFVQAATVRGPGWWVVTPLRADDGRILLVNRGYRAERNGGRLPAGRVTVIGLLRLSEPGGGFLRSNDPAADRWFSRDVAGIAAKRGLGPVAPYFIDAEGTAPGGPIGGLTVVRFANNHLPYAITWYTLAIMAAGGLIYWLRLGRRGGGAR